MGMCGSVHGGFPTEAMHSSTLTRANGEVKTYPDPLASVRAAAPTVSSCDVCRSLPCKLGHRRETDNGNASRTWRVL